MLVDILVQLNDYSEVHVAAAAELFLNALLVS